MADYFVSSSLGSDSTGAGTAANPWKTIEKAIGAAPAIALPGAGPTRLALRGGDTFGEAVAPTLSPTAAKPLEILGDVDGALFAAAGGSPGVGVPTWRSWSNSTTVLTDPCVYLNGRGYVALRKIRFVGGSFGSANVVRLAGATGVEISDCSFVMGDPLSQHVPLISVALDDAGGAGLRIRRCDFGNGGAGQTKAVFVTVGRADANYDADLLMESCRVRGGARGLEVSLGSGSKTGTATGLRVACCTMDGTTMGALVNAGLAGGAVTVTGCVFLGATYGVNASALGQIVENYNQINAVTPRNNVTAGANSIVSVAPAFYLENWRLDGRPARPFLEPLAGSTALGFVPRPTGVTLDLYGRNRPDPCAAGCLERVDPPAPVPPPRCLAY